MSMLAEPRSRQKWSDDPRNTRWASDKTKFGYQMLTRMGWSEGKGLGQKLSGGVSHIKVQKSKNKAGIGTKTSHDDDWIAQQEDFNALLSQLNQVSNKDGTVVVKKMTSLEERVKLSRKKILYTKVVKSKDLSNATSHDLACIFGQRSKSAPATPQRSDDEDNSDSDVSAVSCPTQDKETDNEHGVTTVYTGVSVADYFAKKMAAMKQARENTKRNVEVQEEQKNSDIDDTRKSDEVLQGTDENDVKSGKKKKRKNIEVDNDCIENESDRLVIRKKKKKYIDGMEHENDITAEKKKNSDLTECDVIEENVRKKKKKKRKLAQEELQDNEKSKKRTKRKESMNNDEIGKISQVNEEIIEKKKKKRSKHELPTVSEEDISSNIAKKKKKKKKKRKKSEVP